MAHGTAFFGVGVFIGFGSVFGCPFTRGFRLILFLPGLGISPGFQFRFVVVAVRLVEERIEKRIREGPPRKDEGG